MTETTMQSGITADQRRFYEAGIEEGYRRVLASAPAWQPIETAPRDGTRFLAVQRNGRMRVDRLNLEKQSPVSKFWEEWGEHDLRYTHWMPLPDAPPEGERKKA